MSVVGEQERRQAGEGKGVSGATWMVSLISFPSLVPPHYRDISTLLRLTLRPRNRNFEYFCATLGSYT